jgi:hypothetical protein
VEEFRRYHIPEATLKRKADEFRELRQGNMSVEEYTYQFIELARYAPKEVDKDSKKQEMFKKGLTLELRTLLTPQIYPDFNTLMNMAILTERARAEEKKENKRKFMEQHQPGHCQQQQQQLPGVFQLPRDWTLHCELPICQEANRFHLLQLGERAKATRVWSQTHAGAQQQQLRQQQQQPADAAAAAVLWTSPRQPHQHTGGTRSTRRSAR